MSDPTGSKAADQSFYTQGTPHPQFGTPRTPDQEEAWAVALEGVEHGMSLPRAEEVNVGEPNCQRCEVIPRPVRGPGTLLLRFGHTHTLGKVLTHLVRTPWPHAEHDGTVSVVAPPGNLAPILSPILDLLSSVEQRDSRATFQPDGSTQAADPFEVQRLPEFAVRCRSDWVLDVLRENRLYAVFHPILRCRAGLPREVFGYECLARADVDGRTVLPGVMFDLARGAGFLFQMDLAARRSAVLAAAAQKLTGHVFINFTPNAIYNPYKCLSSTVRMVDEVGLRRDRVVFEIVETEKLPELPHLKRIVERYRADGFAVALDDVGAGYSSLEVLLALRPDYVKLDMALVRGVHADPAKALVTRKLLEVAQGLGAKTVAEGVETTDELAWVHAHGVDYVQGYLFARPATPPPLPA